MRNQILILGLKELSTHTMSCHHCNVLQFGEDTFCSELGRSKHGALCAATRLTRRKQTLSLRVVSQFHMGGCPGVALVRKYGNLQKKKHPKRMQLVIYNRVRVRTQKGTKKSKFTIQSCVSIMYDYSKLVRWFENSSKAIEKGPNSFLAITVQFILNTLLSGQLKLF